MNRVKRVSRKYLKQKPAIDQVRAANKHIRRANKARRLAREIKEGSAPSPAGPAKRRKIFRRGDVKVSMIGSHGEVTPVPEVRDVELHHQPILTWHQLNDMKVDEIRKIAKVRGLKGVSKLKKEYLINEILSNQEGPFDG